MTEPEDIEERIRHTLDAVARLPQGSLNSRTDTPSTRRVGRPAQFGFVLVAAGLAATLALVLTVSGGPAPRQHVRVAAQPESSTSTRSSPSSSAPASTSAQPSGVGATPGSLTAPPTTVPSTPPTSVSVGEPPAVATTNVRAHSAPAPLPPPCPPVTDTPSMGTGSYCGPPPRDGNGSGPDGVCTANDTAPPCGPGVVLGRYYAYTLPGTCDGLIRFDGKEWVSELPEPAVEPPTPVWMAMTTNGVGWIGPNGAVGFQPYTGQPLNTCSTQPPATVGPVNP